MLDVSVVFPSLLVSRFALRFYSWLGVMLCLYVATVVLLYCRCDWFHSYLVTFAPLEGRGKSSCWSALVLALWGTLFRAPV